MSLSSKDQSTNAPLRLHYIDGMRAVGCLMAVFHHAFMSHIARYIISKGYPVLGDVIWGTTGSCVILFFVVSGVVLLRPFLRDNKKFDPVIFFKKRAIRIFPTYIVALLFGAAVIWYINAYPTWYNEKGIHVIFTLESTLKQAFLFSFDGVYYNLAWWSVQIEVLFYFFIPILIATFPRREQLSYRKILIIVFSVMAISLSLQLLLDAYIPKLYSYHNIVQNVGRIVDYPVCFLMGTLLAVYDFSKKNAYQFIAMGIVLVLLQVIYKPAMHTGYGLIYTGLIIITFYNVSIQKVLSTPFLVWVGERTYSIYLVHFSVFYLVNNLTAHVTTERDFVYALITRGLGIPIAFFLSMLLFHFVERKFAKGLITDEMFWPWQTEKMKH